MTYRFAGVALTAALIAGSAVAQPSASADVTATALRKPAPAFTLHNSNGAPLRLSDYRGQVLLLDFWATWCTGCKQEIPWYMEFQSKYRSKGLSSLGVAMDDEGWRVVTPYLQHHPINYTIVIGDEAFAKIFPITALLQEREKKRSLRITMASAIIKAWRTN
jgi:cytochrome c biogenesis protein CcmG/thiol:disulfide interchange protein DsbE